MNKMETDNTSRYLFTGNVIFRSYNNVVSRVYDTFKQQTVICKKFFNKEDYKKELYMNNLTSKINMIHVLRYDDEELSIYFENGDNDLFELLSKGTMTEDELITRFKNIFFSLYEMHKLSILHGDIKLENIVYKNNDPSLYFIDLGLSEVIKRNQKSKSCFGTRGYYPPEAVSTEGHDLKADVFMLGVTMFVCLTGEMPFQYSTNEEYCYSIQQEQPAFYLLQENGISSEMELLLSQMLEPDPEKRISIGQCVKYLYQVDDQIGL